ncbi:MAG: PVC-type heme-binding CxxCH protein [Verrucomicrobiota bacterium]
MQSGRVPVDVDISGAKNLWLVVSDGGNGYLCDWADWIEPKLIRADGSSVDLTDLKWKSATVGFGEVGRNKNVKGEPLKIDGKVFANGIGTHAPSIIEYELPETNFTRFMAKVGPDHGGVDQNGGTSVEFFVFTEKPPENLLQITSATNDPDRGFGLAAAQEGLKTAAIADGLEATVFAAEPMLRNPTDIDIDARGRVWVCEGVNYRSSFKPWGTLQPAGDRIVILEDTNEDGIADNGKTFYQGTNINSALGICVLGNKVIVSCSPNIFVLTDTDGDDRADKEEILFSGIGGVDHDHGVHAMVFGPDGKLYFNFGNAGGQLKDKNGKLVADLDGNLISTNDSAFSEGMTFRCNLDGGEIEVLGQNFRNPYEVAVDSFGTIWQSDNDDDGNRSVRINYVMEHGNFGYKDEMTGAGWNEAWKKAQSKGARDDEKPISHWHQNDPGVIPNLLVTGAGAPTGITIYEGKLLPEIFRNQIIHCDAGPRVVRSYRVNSDGAGYKAETRDIFSSSDAWFRPSDVCVAPDGSIYIADWNDSGVGGHNMADHDLKTIKGRIYRIAPKGSKPFVPRLNFTTISGSVTALKSPNAATRYLAWDELRALGERAESELLKVWKSDDQRMRARALQLLARIAGREKKYVEQALRDNNSDLRIAGLRIAREIKLDLIPYLKILVKDSQSQMRRECALALRGNFSPEAPEIWAELARQHDGKDRWYLEALGIGAEKQEDKFFEAWLKKVGENWNTASGRDLVWRLRSKKTPAYLAQLISNPKTTDQDREKYFRALDFIKGAEKENALVNLLGLVSP